MRGHHFHKSVAIFFFALPDLSRSTVSAIFGNRKRLEKTTTQPQSGRPRTLTELLKHIAHKKCLLSHYSLQSFKLPLEATSAQQLCIVSFMKCISMAEQLHTSPKSLCNGVKLTAGLWNSGTPFHSLE